MPFAVLNSTCFVRRRAVSSTARRIDSVMVSAYRIAVPFRLRAARPIVWIRLRSERRKPSLSASRIATEHAQPQVPDDLDAFDRVDVGVQVAHLNAVLGQVVGQVLGHALGQGRD
jgi:hypothetical protein